MDTKHTMTHPTTSQDATQARWNGRVDRYVENHYGHVMPPYQRDLVKQIVKGEPTLPARPFIYRVCQRIAKEVLAVISADQGTE
jgi:hypothetical protein